MKYLLIILIAMSLTVFSGCDLKRFSANKSTPANTQTRAANDTIIPPKVGNFTRTEPPNRTFVNPSDAPNVNKDLLSAPYTLPDGTNRVSLIYVQAYDKGQADWWIGQMTEKSTEDCKDLDADELKLTQEQDEHFKIIKRESKDGGELIVMQKDQKSLCNKGQKDMYEKVYFVRGDIIFLARRYDIKEYGVAEQFMNEYLKTREKP